MTAGQQEVQADAEGQLSGPMPMPVTEVGLDNAMEELALEVRCALTHLWTISHACVVSLACSMLLSRRQADQHWTHNGQFCVAFTG